MLCQNSLVPSDLPSLLTRTCSWHDPRCLQTWCDVRYGHRLESLAIRRWSIANHPSSLAQAAFHISGIRLAYLRAPRDASSRYMSGARLTALMLKLLPVTKRWELPVMRLAPSRSQGPSGFQLLSLFRYAQFRVRSG